MKARKTRDSARSRSIALCVICLLIGAWSGVAQAQPTISKVFTPNVIGPGSVSTITITITNNAMTAVENLAFTDTLPVMPGPLIIADPANALTDCDLGISGSLSAPDGGSTITLSDARLGSMQSCKIEVNVTAATPGAHTNPAITLMSSAGSSMSLPVDLTVVTTRPGFSKSFAPSSVPLGDKSTLTFTIDNTLNAMRVGNLRFTDNLPIGMVVADPANAASDCVNVSFPNTTVTAVPGSNSIMLEAIGSPSFPGQEVLSEGATCTVTVDVVSTGAGMLDNVSDELLADSTSAGKASDTLEVTVTPLAIQKSFVDDPTPPGGTVILDFTIDNFDRIDAATSVAFSDDLTMLVPPLAGLTFDSLLSNDCGGSVSGVGGTTIALSGGTIAPEGFCTISVSLSVPAGATPGAYTNTTSAVTANVGGSMVVGNMASDDLVIDPVPTFTKEFIDDPVNAGGQVTLRFTITNTDPTAMLTDLEFTDDIGGVDPRAGALPGLAANGLVAMSGLEPEPLVDPCGSGSQLTIPDPNDSLPSPPFPNLAPDPTMLIFTGGTLAAAGSAGDSCTFDVVLDVPADAASGTYTNTTSDLEVSASPVAPPASDDLIVIAAPPLIKEFTDDPVAPGATVTLQFTLAHPAEASTDATDITFTDDLAMTLAGLVATGLPLTDPCGTGSSLAGSSGDTLLTLTNGTLMPGADCTFSVTLSVPAGAAPDTYTNTSSNVTATVAGLSATSGPASDDLKVAGIDFSKEFIDDPVIPGDTATLRFTITNIHPMDNADSIQFTDNLNAVLTGLSAVAPLPATPCGPSSAITGTTSLSFSGGELMVGESCTFDVTVQVPASAADDTYNNLTSSLDANQNGAVSFDPAVDSLVVNATLLQLTKDFTNDPVAPSDNVTLEFTLTNLDATRSASGIGFTDDLDAALSGLTFDSVLLDSCGDVVSGIGTTDVTVTSASLAAAASCTLRLSLSVPAGAAAGIYTNTTSDITGTINGLAVRGDAASDELEVLQLLNFSKSFDGPTTATANAILTFTISNPGNDTVTNIDFSDDLDSVISGLIATSLPSVPCGTDSSVTGISVLAFQDGELPPMGMCSFDIQVLVPASASAGTFPNATSDLTTQGLKVSNPATANLVIEPPPTFAKAFSPSALGLGQTSTLTFTVDNTASAVAASNLAFTDNLPAGMTVANPPNPSVMCTGGTLTALAGSSTVSYSGGTVSASASCTISVDVVGGALGSLANTSGDLTSSSGNSGTASDTLTVNPQPGFTKSFAPNPIAIGGTSTLTFTIDNSGSTIAASSLDFSDNLPAAVTVASAPNAATTCTGGILTAASGSGTISYSGGTVNAGTSCTVSVDVTSSTVGIHANVSGDLTSSLGNSGTAADTLTVDPPPGFSKAFAPANIAAGGVSTLTFTIDNSASALTASTLDFSDNLPAAVTVASAPNAATTCTGGTLTAASGSSLISYTGGTVSAGASCTVNVDVTSSTGGIHVNLSGDLTSSLGNSGSATDTLSVDASAPTVSAVTTAAGPLATCDTVRQPVTSITVTLQDDPVIVNAADPASYLLLAAGPDGDFATNACGAVAGDDVAVTINMVTVVGMGPADATLDIGSLDAGLYRLLVCDSIIDNSGNALDGDGNMIPGGDFVLPFFRMDPFNLFDNGHFDNCPVTLTPWASSATVPNIVQTGMPGTDDADSSPLSASAHVSHSASGASSIGQCVPVDANTVYQLEARFRFDPPAGAAALFARSCEFFSAANCAGTSLGNPSSVSLIEDQGGVWTPSIVNVSSPAGAASALCDFTVQDVGNDPNFDLFLDNLSFGSEGSIIFRDGFEEPTP